MPLPTIRPGTQALAQEIMRVCLASGDLNAGLEATALALMLHASMIGKEEHLPASDIAFAMLVHADSVLQASEAARTMLADAKAS